MTCKKWALPSSQVKPLCNNLYLPVEGSSECPVCVTPIESSPASCSGCPPAVSFANGYKVQTPSGLPSTNVGSAAYQQSRSYTYDGALWEVQYTLFDFQFTTLDIAKLWAYALGRGQQLNLNAVPPSCQVQATCTWGNGYSQQGFYWQKYPGTAQDCSHVGSGGGFTLGQKISWPRTITRTFLNGAVSCPYYEAFPNVNYHTGVNIYPNAVMNWPSGFGTLSGTTSCPGTPNILWGECDGGPAYPECPSYGYSLWGSRPIFTLQGALSCSQSAADQLVWYFSIFHSRKSFLVQGWSRNGVPFLPDQIPPAVSTAIPCTVGPGANLVPNGTLVQYVGYTSCSTRNAITMTKTSAGGAFSQQFPQTILVSAV